MSLHFQLALTVSDKLLVLYFPRTA